MNMHQWTPTLWVVWKMPWGYENGWNHRATTTLLRMTKMEMILVSIWISDISKLFIWLKIFNHEPHTFLHCTYTHFLYFSCIGWENWEARMSNTTLPLAFEWDNEIRTSSRVKFYAIFMPSYQLEIKLKKSLTKRLLVLQGWLNAEGFKEL